MRIIVNHGAKQKYLEMLKIIYTASFAWFSLIAFSQEQSIESFLNDSSMINASVSFCVADIEKGEIVLEYNSQRSITPASVMKLITSAAAIELLGPGYTFKTMIGYSGSLNRRTGRLTGDIIIQGGGDPVLGSGNFSDHYYDFTEKWVTEIKKLGIKKIEGRVITDDSYYDFLPVPSKWLWEDAGNYYGAGAFGLSVFDNTYEIHIKTSSGKSGLEITAIVPNECNQELSNWLVAAGTSDQGYVFSAPYSSKGWLAGTIPENRDDFILKASITDPPLLLAKILNNKLEEEGISISEDPSTFRLEKIYLPVKTNIIAEVDSPPLNKIIEVLNHESINLYAEHLLKELGKRYRNEGSTAAGIEVVLNFLHGAGITTEGMFIEDGSGLSPLDALNAAGVAKLLIFMNTRGKYFPDYYSSLPEAGKEGTLVNYFKDPVFDSRLKAKSGSMTRVRAFAGYFTTLSGKQMVFSILVNNYSGSSRNIISRIEEIIKGIILHK